MTTMFLMFAMIVLMGSLLKSGEVMLSRSRAKKELSAPTPEDEAKEKEEREAKAAIEWAFAPTPEDTSTKPESCSFFVTHIFERRLVEGGVQTEADMSVCDKKGCEECAPIRAAKVAAEKAVREAERERREAEIMEHQKKILEEKKLAARRKRESNIRRAAADRTRDIGGFKIVMPAAVPNHAFGQWKDRDALSGIREIIWTWHDRDTGQETKYAQPLMVDQYELMGDDKAVSEWQEVYDPDTHEYLGRFRRVAGKVEVDADDPKAVESDDDVTLAEFEDWMNVSIDNLLNAAVIPANILRAGSLNVQHHVNKHHNCDFIYDAKADLYRDHTCGVWSEWDESDNRWNYDD